LQEYLSSQHLKKDIETNGKKQTKMEKSYIFHIDNQKPAFTLDKTEPFASERLGCVV
jgi:hypothetical protein